MIVVLSLEELTCEVWHSWHSSLRWTLAKWTCSEGTIQLGAGPSVPFHSRRSWRNLRFHQEKRCFMITFFIPLQGYYIKKESRFPLCGLRRQNRIRLHKRKILLKVKWATWRSSIFLIPGDVHTQAGGTPNRSVLESAEASQWQDKARGRGQVLFLPTLSGPCPHFLPSSQLGPHVLPLRLLPTPGQGPLLTPRSSMVTLRHWHLATLFGQAWLWRLFQLWSWGRFCFVQEAKVCTLSPNSGNPLLLENVTGFFWSLLRSKGSKGKWKIR